jgi:hypothetical protein
MMVPGCLYCLSEWLSEPFCKEECHTPTTGAACAELPMAASATVATARCVIQAGMTLGPLADKM